MKFLHLILLCAFLMLSACTRQEVSPREYPRLATHPVTEITSGGAVFNGEITFATSASFTDYGFIWSQKKTPVITNSDTLSLGSSSGTLHFTSRIDHALLEGQTYYVRSYARASDGYLVYGNIESFVSQGTATPYSVIGIENNTDILPYDQINVLGNFSDHVSIKLNGVDMPLILKSSGSLSFKLPPKSPDGGFVEVTIEGQAFPVVKGPRMMLSFVHDLSDQITSFSRQAGIGLGENGYFGFGSNTGNPSYPATTDSVYVYDPATNSLTSIQSNNPLPRASSVVFAIGNLIYFGAPSGASDFYAYNPTTNVFTQLNDMPSSLALKGFTLNEKGYVFFGNGAVNSFYQYNPANDTWTSQAYSGVPVSTYDRTFAFSQEGAAYMLDIHDWAAKSFTRFDAATGAWSNVSIPSLSYLYYSATGDFIMPSANGNTYLLDLWHDDNGVFYTAFNKFNAKEERIMSIPRYTRQLFRFRTSFTVNNVAYLVTDVGLWKFKPTKY